MLAGEVALFCRRSGGMALHHSTMRCRGCQNASLNQLRSCSRNSLLLHKRCKGSAAVPRATGLEPGWTASRSETFTTSTLESSVDEAVQNTGREALSSLGIPAITPEQLFDARHVAQWTPLLLAYLPFGCVLAVLRMAAWVAGIALDASWFRNRAVIDAYMALLGVTVKWEGDEDIPAERHVLVSNHITTGDLLVLFQRPQRYVHLITTALPQKVYDCQHLPAILQPANKHTYQALAETAPLTRQQQQQQQQQEEDHLLVAGGSTALQLQPNSSSSHASSSSNSSNTSSAASSAHLQEHSQAQHKLQQQQPMHSNPVGDKTALDSSSSSSSSHLVGQPQHSGLDHLSLQQEHQHVATSLQRPQQQRQQQQQQPSVHLFPEGGMTNGKGMMRFSRGFMLFADKLPVVPVALRVRVPFPQISSHTIDSDFLSNLFWCSFQPWTVLEAKALPALQLAPGESKAAFVQRVQLAIAEELGVWITDMNIQQKRQLAGARAKKPQKQHRR